MSNTLKQGNKQSSETCCRYRQLGPGGINSRLSVIEYFFKNEVVVHCRQEGVLDARDNAEILSQCSSNCSGWRLGR